MTKLSNNQNLKSIRLVLQLIMAFLLIHHSWLKAISNQQYYLGLGIFCSLGVYNLFLFFNKYKKKHNFFEQPLFQIILDQIHLLLFFYLMGGIHNPYCTLLIMPLTISPFFIFNKLNLVPLGFSLLSLYLLSFSDFLYWHTYAFVQIDMTSTYIIFIVLWSLAYWFSLILLDANKKIDLLHKKEQRISHLHAMGNLTSSFCHELSTPLGTMRFKIDKLVEGRATEKDINVLKEELENCESSLQSLIQTTQNYDSNRNSIEEINDLLQSIKREKVSFEPFEKPLYSKLDPQQLVMILNDLITNSFEAQSTKINISCSTNKQYIVITISDNGDGFKPIIIENFGTAFNSTKPHGNGLALYNALSYFELIDGHLEIANDSNGAVVTILLPIYESINS